MGRRVLPVLRYAGAVGLTALAVGARWWLAPYLGEKTPFVMNFISVATAAWLCGPGPGLVVLGLSAAASVYLFVVPRGTFSVVGSDDLLGLGLFLVNGVVVVSISAAQRSAQRRAEASALAARRALESERAQREQLKTTLDGIGDAVIVADAGGRVTLLNPAAARLTGWSSADAAGRPLDDVFRVVDQETRRPAEGPTRRALGEGAVVPSPDRAAVVDRDGRERPIDAVTSPVRGDDGTTRGVVVVFRDVTDRRRDNDALRQSERLFRLLADAMPQIVWVSDPSGTLEYLNSRWFEYTGLTHEESFAPGGTASAIHPDDLPLVEAAAARSEREHGLFEAEFRLRDRRGRYRWHLVRSVLVRDDAGRDVRRFGTTTDIDDRKRAERGARFLAEASASLATLDDEEVALRALAGLAVPFFADGCVVDVTREDGSIRRLASAHADPARLADLDELTRRYPPLPDDPNSAIIRVLRDRRPEFVAEVTDAMVAAAARDGEHAVLLRRLGLHSYMAVPLNGRGGALGVISFATSESARRFVPDDLRLAEDLAHRAAIAVENIRLAHELKAADRKKDEFLATLAHELRNPLAPVRNALYLMDRAAGADPAFAQERAMLGRQVYHLTRLVDDLLDVSRIRKGKIELRRERLELAPVVRQAVEATRPFYEAGRHELAVSVPPGSIPLEADPTRLEQIFWNLLNNAAKYTEPGGRVELTATPEGGRVTVSVRDNGIGIAPDMLPHVFELFVQADSQAAHAQGGLGIGLSLVRELVKMHGGTIEARSAGPGLGSEFVLRLPLAAPAAAEVPAPHEPEPVTRAVPERRRVLVVDDNVDAAVSLSRLLTRLYGQEVRVAHDGASAVSAAAEFRPDLVLLDLGLPGMDGYEVARRLRDEPGGNGTVLVAVTGRGQDADRERTRAAGFARHLLKPVDPDLLGEILAMPPGAPGHQAG